MPVSRELREAASSIHSKKREKLSRMFLFSKDVQRQKARVKNLVRKEPGALTEEWVPIGPDLPGTALITHPLSSEGPPSGKHYNSCKD